MTMTHAIPPKNSANQCREYVLEVLGKLVIFRFKPKTVFFRYHASCGRTSLQSDTRFLRATTLLLGIGGSHVGSAPMVTGGKGAPQRVNVEDCIARRGC
jgi:hypothetical protein